MQSTQNNYYNKLCGIIGGLGPEATNYLFGLIIKLRGAKKDQDHIPLLIFNNPQIPDRTGYLTSGKDNPEPELISTARILKAAGATFLAIPCNTAHAFISQIEIEGGIEVLNMIKLTALYIAKNYGEEITVGLLATDGTIQSGVYQKVFSALSSKIHILLPDEDGQKCVMEAIYGDKGIKASFVDEHNAKLLHNEAEKLINKGASLIIEGCTEIPLVLPQKSCSFLVIDPMEILAKEILKRVLL